MRLRRLGGFLALSAAFACGPSAAPASPEVAPAHGSNAAPPIDVVFDQTLAQPPTPLEISFDGMSRLAGLLRRHGARVSINNDPLDRFLTLYTGPGRVLVLSIPWGERYSRTAIRGVHRFLDSGGGVLVVTEHDDFYQNATVQNELTEPLGITTLTARGEGVPGPDNNDGRWPSCSIDRWDLDDIRMFWPAPLHVQPPAQPLMRVDTPADPELDVVAAINEEHAGPLVVLADLEILWNMTPDEGVRAHENPAFVRRLFAFLGGRSEALSPAQNAPVLREEWSRGDRVALFESTGLGFYPDGAASGFERLAAHLNAAGYAIRVGGGRGTPYEEVDLAIVIAPLEPLDWPEGIVRARRLLLVGDGRTDFVRAEHVVIEPLLGNHPKDEFDYPLDELARSRGLAFRRATLLDGAGSMLLGGHWVGDGEALPLHRSATIEVTDRGRRDAIETLAVAEPGSWPVISLAPTLSPERFASLPQRVAHGARSRLELQREAWPVVVRGPDVMAVADFELLADQALSRSSGRRILREIDAWLAD